VFDGKVRQSMGQAKGFGNELTIFADKRTRVQQALDDNSIPTAVYFLSINMLNRYKFVDFNDIGKYKGENIDIIGQATFKGSYPRDSDKREIILSNERGQTIEAVFCVIME